MKEEVRRLVEEDGVGGRGEVAGDELEGVVLVRLQVGRSNDGKFITDQFVELLQSLEDFVAKMRKKYVCLTGKNN